MNNVADIASWLPYLNSGGVLGLLVVIVLGGARGWWYYGRAYDAKAKECEDWKGVALGTLSTIQDVVQAMEPIVEKLASRP